MATVNLFASEVMDDAAALLNDPSRSLYNYVVQIPYLNIALKELRKHFERVNLAATDETTSVPLVVPIGSESLVFAPTPPVIGVSYLPNDLVDIRKAWQRQTGSGQQYIPLKKIDGLPLNLEGIQLNYLDGYVWENQTMKFLPALVSTDVKLEYVRQLFPLITVETDEILCINGDSFLAARTAALVAKYVEENEQRSAELNSTAALALDNVQGIDAKGRQSTVTRRRPFRAGFKSRG